MSSSFNSTSRPWPGRRGGGIRCLLPQCGISCSCAAPAGVVHWTNHNGAAAGDHENEGRCQREEQPGGFSPTHWPCSLAGQSIIEHQARWAQWRRLVGGTLVLQAGDRGRGKGERRWKRAEQLHFDCNIGRQQSHFTIPLPFNFSEVLPETRPSKAKLVKLKRITQK